MSSHNTENETSNRTAFASIVYCFFALPQNLKFPDLLPRRIVKFRVSPNPNPNLATMIGSSRWGASILICQPNHAARLYTLFRASSFRGSVRAFFQVLGPEFDWLPHT